MLRVQQSQKGEEMLNRWSHDFPCGGGTRAVALIEILIAGEDGPALPTRKCSFHPFKGQMRLKLATFPDLYEENRGISDCMQSVLISAPEQLYYSCI